jgi:myo-inositol-1(or 4)-monophosphatase
MTTPTIDLLVEWARAAGAILREGYGQQHQISRKGRIDLVTAYDHRSEAYLLERIRASFPGDSIHAEESGLFEGGDARWFIDPLDGTTNYAHGIPAFSVSLAYAVRGSVLLGVVYDPMRDECFTAGRGHGAWLGSRRLRVSGASEFPHSLLVTGFPYEVGPDGRDNLRHFAHFTRLTQGVRRMGSAALDLCYVAAGRFDGYWELTLKPWDMAAGGLLVEEAGGRISRIDGSPEYLLPPYSVLAGSPAIYEQMLSEMRALD